MEDNDKETRLNNVLQYTEKCAVYNTREKTEIKETLPLSLAFFGPLLDNDVVAVS